MDVQHIGVTVDSEAVFFQIVFLEMLVDCLMGDFLSGTRFHACDGKILRFKYDLVEMVLARRKL